MVAEADTRIAAARPDTNYGRSSVLRVDAGGDPEVRSYLRFNIQNLPGNVVSATLRLYVTSSAKRGPEVYGTSSDWDENTLTWNNRPHRDTALIASGQKAVARTWITYDVTRLVNGNAQ